MQVANCTLSVYLSYLYRYAGTYLLHPMFDPPYTILPTLKYTLIEALKYMQQGM